MAGPGYELKENEAKVPAQVLDKGNRSLQSFAPPYVGNYAEGAKNQYKIDSDTLNRIQADVNQITSAIRSRSDSLYWQTQIVFLIAGWKEQDRRLIGSMGSPHLDKGLELLEAETYSNTSIGGDVLQENNGIEQLYYFFNPGKRLTFLEQLKASEAYKHYAEYMKPEITNSFLHHELRTAQEISQCIKRGDITGADSLLSQSSFYNIDDVALGVLQFLDDKELKTFLSLDSPEARIFATKLIDELSAGQYAEDERWQVERLKKAYSEWFLGRNVPQREHQMAKSFEKWRRRIDDEENLQNREAGDIFIIPIGSAGIGMGESTVSASLGNDGKILVRVHLKSVHIEYQKQLPYWIESTGIWLDPDEPVLLKFLDQETARRFQRSTVLVPASFLLEISNEGTTEVIQKLLAWGLAGFFAPFIAVPAIGVAGVEGSSAAMVAVVLATEAVGAVSLALNLVRNDLINLYGDEARKWFAIMDVVDMAMGIYGLGALLYHAPSILKGLRDFPSKFLKESAARKNGWLTAEEMAKLNKDLENLERAEQEVSKIRSAADRVKGMDPKAPQTRGAISTGTSAHISGLQTSGIPYAVPAGTLPVSGNNAEALSKFQLPAPGLTGASLKDTRAPFGSNGGRSSVRTGTGANSVTGSKSVNVGELRPNHPPAADVGVTKPKAPFGNKPTPDWVTDPALLPQEQGVGPSGSGAAEARLELPASSRSKPASGKTVTESEGWRFASSGNSGVSAASKVKPSAGVKTTGSDPTALGSQIVEPPPKVARAGSKKVDQELKHADRPMGLGREEMEWTPEQLRERGKARLGRTRTGGLSPAQVSLSAKWEWDDKLGIPKAVEYDIPRRVGNVDVLGQNTRPDKFKRGQSPFKPDDFTGTPGERAHAVGQQNSGAGITSDLGLPGLDEKFSAGAQAEVAEDLMQMDNVWYAEGRGPKGVNQGAFEDAQTMMYDLKNNNPSADLRLRIEAMFVDPVKFVVSPSGVRLPKPDRFVFTATVTPTKVGGVPNVVREIVVNNLPGGSPVIVIDVPVFP